MHVKNYQEAAKAIHDITSKARIPVISMVAILETEKFQLLCSTKGSKDEKFMKEFFDNLQEHADEANANKGVS